MTFAAQYGQVQKELLKGLALPYAILDGRGKLLWFNHEFEKISGHINGQYHGSIMSVIPAIVPEKFPQPQEESNFYFTYGQASYRANIKHISIESLAEDVGFPDAPDSAETLYAVFLFDETELRRYIKKYEDETMVAGLIYLDNYEEAMESVEEVRRSLLTALIDRKISKYFADIGGMVKKFEKDKYFLVLRTAALNQLKEMRFTILEEVKTVNIGNEMAMTISIGLGANGDSYNTNFEYARIAIDLALGRGGDQAVLRDGDHITYFGGKSLGVEKSTRVKARVKAHALRELMISKKDVIVMGHKLTDADAFGAAVGIFRAACSLEKKAYIVVDTVNASISALIEAFLQDEEGSEEIVVNCRRAQELASEDTLVVVVDTNRPGYTECEALLKIARTVVVLDHHRQGSDAIQNTALSYIEPYASSACEMVAEILQYFSDDIKIRNVEADAIYAGIVVDTDNFMQKTGVRTFEAAAFLRRCGADVTRVRKLFREDAASYRARGEAIRNAELFRGAYAISECPPGNLESPTVIGAQAANELLNIAGVKASFVLTEYNSQIYISARAIDEKNVQIIMEKMGGGGHLNMAGCQLTHVTMDEAKNMLKETLISMEENGEI